MKQNGKMGEKESLPVWGGLVPHIRVELMIFCVRGRCPGPLDECGSSVSARPTITP